MDFHHTQAWAAHFKEMYKSHESDVNTVFNWLADEKSKEIYKNIVAYKKTRNKKYLKGIVTIKACYFPSTAAGVDIFRFNNETIVDCGAYNGDSIKEFIKKAKKQIKAIIAFEPDKRSFEQLESYVTKMCPKDIKVTLYNAGVYDRCAGSLCFNEDENAVTSSLSDTGKKTIQVVAIDECPECVGATFIKMDVEGAELAALYGARETIKANKPKLAISIYHKAEDFWTIPYFIRQLNPDYKLYIRHHSYSWLETVLYAV
jgi:FkbM family methyltransferase